jgi:uncharacterized protein YcnI
MFATRSRSLTSVCRRVAWRGVGVATGVGAAVVLAATVASAHVHVIPDDTASGGDAQLTFRVPSEEPVATTTRVVLTLPQDRPLPSVAIKPLPGWTASVTEGPLPRPVTVDGTTVTRAPRTITWTASPAAALGPDQYQDFSIAVAPLPSPGELIFPVTQIYSDGTVVHWDQPSPAGQPEPEHPAPSFVVTAAAPDTPNPSADDQTRAVTAALARSASDPMARWLGVVALVVALAVVAFSLARLLLERRRAAGGAA